MVQQESVLEVSIVQGAVRDKLSVNTRAVDATYAIDRQRAANALLARAAFPTSLRSVRYTLKVSSAAWAVLQQCMLCEACRAGRSDVVRAAAIQPKFLVQLIIQHDGRQRSSWSRAQATAAPLRAYRRPEACVLHRE